MIFHELSLENIGVFKGKQTISLAPKPGKPLVLIGALNGAGKTTILEAFQLVLYGRHASNLRAQKSYNRYISRLINREVDPELGAAIELCFEMDTRPKRQQIRIHRSWKVHNGQIREELKVFENEIFSPFLTAQWDSCVEEILPSRLAELFFFDGEKIETITDLSQAADIVKRGLHILLSLDRIEELRRNLHLIRRRRLAQLEQPAANSSISLSEQHLNEALELRREVLQRRASIQNDFDSAEMEVKAASKEFQHIGGARAIEIEHWQLKERAAVSKSEREEQNARQLAAGDMPLLLVQPLLTEAYLSCKKAEARMDAQVAANAVKGRDHFYLGLLRELEVAPELHRIIDRRLSETRVPVVSAYSNAVDIHSQRLYKFVHKEFAESRTVIVEILQKHASSQKEIADARQVLQSIGDQSQTDQAWTKLQSAEQALATHRATLQLLETELLGIDRKIETLQKKLHQDMASVSQQVSTANDHRRVIQHALLADKSLEMLQQAVLTRSIANISAHITRAFRTLARKEDLLVNVTVDPKTFELRLFGKKNKEIEASELSAAERQLLALALLAGLAKASGRRIPMVIDTPLARFDGTHRVSLVDRYFPKASHQTIILSTDVEIDDHLRTRLKPITSQTYLLQFNEVLNGSEVKSGYFS